MFAGVTAPLLLAAAFIVLVIAGCNDSSPQPPRADVNGACAGATEGRNETQACPTALSANSGILVHTATPLPPTPTPVPRMYTVQPDDALSLICANQAPDMSQDACVGAIVSLNRLSGPDQVFAGQSLQLPPDASAGAAGTAATPASARAVPATPTPAPPTPAPVETEPTPEPEVAETAPETTPHASLVPLLDAAGGAGAAETERVTEAGTEPTASRPEPTAGDPYTVQSGDTLMAICIAQVPELPEDDCVEVLVFMNELGGPDAIFEGQVLALP